MVPVQTPGTRSVQRTQQTFCFLFAIVNSLTAEWSLFSKRSLSLIYSISSLFANSLGNIGYFCVMRKILWAPPSLFTIYSKHSDLLFASVQQTANSRSVEHTEQTSNKTFAVFAELNRPQLGPETRPDAAMHPSPHAQTTQFCSTPYVRIQFADVILSWSVALIISILRFLIACLTCLP